MTICIGNVLSVKDLREILNLLSESHFTPGARTAGWAARPVKNNLQLARESASFDALQSKVRGCLQHNEVFMLAACPQHFSNIVFGKYEMGMGYGTHVDNAIMGENSRFRSDLAFTVFLSDPGDYEGGELVIQGLQGHEEYKLDAGSAVLYPATSLHRVEVVSKGIRLVAVGWLQSMVREAAKREILFELETLRTRVFQQYGGTEEFDILSKNVSNLWRMWAEV